MPGYNKSRFVGLHEVDDDLLCGICLAVFNNPLVTQCCQQTYCGDCIKLWLNSNNTCPNDGKVLTIDGLVEPQRLIKIMINKFEMSCDFAKNGCKQILTLGQLTQHLLTCKHNPEAKCDVCNEKIGDQTAHNCAAILLRKNKELEECYRDLKNNVNKLSKDCEHYRAIRQLLNDKNGKLLDENQNLSSRSQELNAQLKKVTENCEKHAKQLTDELRKWKTTETELTDEITRLKHEKRAIEEKLESLNQIMSKITKHSEKLRNEMNVFDKRNKHKIEPNCVHKRKTSASGSLDASFQFQVENISKLSEFESVFQHPPICAHGFEWRIIAEHHIDEDNEDKCEYLGVYLGCDNGSVSDWSYYTNVELKLVLPKFSGNDYCVNFEHNFCHMESLYGFSDFMRWSDVFGDGFVANDSITIEVVISAINSN